MKLLVLNKGFSDNLGDRAINESLTSLLVENQVDTIFRDLTSSTLEKISVSAGRGNGGGLRRFFLFLPVEIRWTIKNFFSVVGFIKRADMLLIGGGQLILSNAYFPWTTFFWCLIAKLYRRDFHFYGIGVGNYFSKYQRFLFKFALKNARSITVRSVPSARHLKQFFDISSQVTHDPVFALSSLIKQDRKSQKIFLVGIVDFEVFRHYNQSSEVTTREEYYELWRQFIRPQNKENQQIVLFNTTDSDLRESEQFLEYLKKEAEDAILKPCYELSTLIDLISQANVVLSGRMHALIIATSFRCNFVVPFPISHKIKEYQELYSKIDIDDVMHEIRMDLSRFIRKSSS